MPLPITGFYSGVFGLYLVTLAGKVVRARLRHRVALGDGTMETVRSLLRKGEPDNKELLREFTPLTRAIRVHGNYLEQVVPSLLLIGLLENNGGSPTLIHSLALSLLLSRLLHAEIGLNQPNSLGPGRKFGTALSIGVLVVSSVANIYHGYLGLF